MECLWTELSSRQLRIDELFVAQKVSLCERELWWLVNASDFGVRSCDFGHLKSHVSELRFGEGPSLQYKLTCRLQNWNNQKRIFCFEKCLFFALHELADIFMKFHAFVEELIFGTLKIEIIAALNEIRKNV